MIQIQGLTKRYAQLTALDNLSLDIGPGQVFGFIGPNGAGKTTTMKILACLMKPDAGHAKVAGYDIAKDADGVRRAIGYMPDFLGVYDDLTVDEYLQFFAAAFAIPRAKRSSLVGQVLELTDLTEKRHAPVEGLSRGMQQRLGVARVLIHDPKVLLLDEPASGLDPRARIEMRSLLQELGKMGKTLMVSSHILSELAEMCNSIGIIERGKLLYAGSIEDAYAKTRAASSIGQRIVVTLDTDPNEHAPTPTRIADQLRADPRFVGVACDEASRTLTIELPQGQTSQHDVIEKLLACGAKITNFAPEQIKLEDAFLKLTTGALQ